MSKMILILALLAFGTWANADETATDLSFANCRISKGYDRALIQMAKDKDNLLDYCFQSLGDFINGKSRCEQKYLEAATKINDEKKAAQIYMEKTDMAHMKATTTFNDACYQTSHSDFCWEVHLVSPKIDTKITDLILGSTGAPQFTCEQTHDDIFSIPPDPDHPYPPFAFDPFDHYGYSCFDDPHKKAHVTIFDQENDADIVRDTHYQDGSRIVFLFLHNPELVFECDAVQD